MASIWWCGRRWNRAGTLSPWTTSGAWRRKLAGKKSLGIDRPTEIVASGGMQTVGPWYQSPPKDFSQPELRWFSWGFERQALFVAKVRRAAAGPANWPCAARLARTPSARISTWRFRCPRRIRRVAAVNLKELVLVR